MFKKISQWLGRSHNRAPDAVLPKEKSRQKRIRLECRVDTTRTSTRQSDMLVDRVSTSLLTHRERIHSMPLDRTKLCSPNRCERLRNLGILTAGDLLEANAVWVASHFPAKNRARRAIRRYQRAIGISVSIPKMMPREAMLLFSVHRKHLKSLAADSPSQLVRDLERFSESSQGRKQLRGTTLPSVERVKSWIDYCVEVESSEAHQGLAG